MIPPSFPAVNKSTEVRHDHASLKDDLRIEYPKNSTLENIGKICDIIAMNR